VAKRGIVKTSKKGEMNMEQNLDKALLKGLEFSGAKATKDKKTGKKIWTPFTRPLKEEDIMSSVETKDGFIITTKDGRKYRLPQDGGKKDKPEPGK
jgi:hypothetical protein